MSTAAKIALGVSAGILIAVVALIAGCLALIGAGVEEIDRSLRLPNREHRISKAEYNAIENGMSKQEVVRQLGEPQSEDSTRIRGAPRFNVPAQQSDCIYYGLEGRGAFAPGSSVQLCFTNDRLDMKSIF